MRGKGGMRTIRVETIHAFGSESITISAASKIVPFK